MVSFGQTLRMSRRRGWEPAYLNYEGLKLLSTQIEAVYDDCMTAHHDSMNHGSHNAESSAFVGSSNYNFSSSFGGVESHFGGGFGEDYNYYVNDPNEHSEKDRNHHHNGRPDRDFRDEIFADSNSSDAFVSSSPDSSSNSSDEDDHYNFFVNGSNNNLKLSNYHQDGSKSFFRYNDVEIPLDTFPSQILPSKPNRNDKKQRSGRMSNNNNNNNNHNNNNRNAIYRNKRQKDCYGSYENNKRKKTWFLSHRRKRRRRRKRRKLPLGLRVAHDKANAITERFLGLLRAEVEKVTLFTHSRLGELADTLGSLRFISYEDGIYANEGYELPLSDGGMHPSASSSSEHDGNMMHQDFSWSDEEIHNHDDESNDAFDVSNHSDNISFLNNNLTPSLNTATISTNRTYRRSSSNRNTERRNRRRSKVTKEFKINRTASRQIVHGDKLRIDRPMFQSSSHVVGEDLLLLSAVDEADAYTALGVELMHLLRFIAVNVIAIRKICKKHDKLLNNRMLGGYYHRRNKRRLASHSIGGKSPSFGKINYYQDDNELVPEHSHFYHTKIQRRNPLTDNIFSSNKTFRNNGESQQQSPVNEPLGGILWGSVLSSSDFNTVTTDRHKLIGIYDIKLQKLANSPMVDMISSSLALALSEYEVSKYRAESALSRLNHPDTPIRRNVSRQRIYPKNFGSSRTMRRLSVGSSESFDSSQGTGGDHFISDERQINGLSSDDGAPSTSSSVSLNRLRFVVTSVYALREAARHKSVPFQEYLARSGLGITGQEVIGEGLDGCSRKTLDFLYLCNPDAALLLDSHTLLEQLCEGRFSNEGSSGLGGLMHSSLELCHQFGMQQQGKQMSQRQQVRGSRHTVSSTLSIVPHKIATGGRRHSEFVSELDFKRDLQNPDTPLFSSLLLNLSSALLSKMNYYVIFPSALFYSCHFTGSPVYSVFLIGSINFSSLIASIFFANWIYSKKKSLKGSSFQLLSSFRSSLFVLSLFAMIGNIVYSVSYQLQFFSLGIFGRLLIGISSSDVLSHSLISSCVTHVGVVQEMAKLAKTQIFGISIAFFIGTSIVHITEKDYGSKNNSMNLTLFGLVIEFNLVTLPGYVMSFLWMIQMTCLYYFFPNPNEKIVSQNSHNRPDNETNETGRFPGTMNQSSIDEKSKKESEDFQYTSTSKFDGENIGPPLPLSSSISDITVKADLRTTYGTHPIFVGSSQSSVMEQSIASENLIEMSEKKKKRTRNRSCFSRRWVFTFQRARELLFQQNVVVPVAMAIYIFVCLAIEIMLTSSQIVMYRYFDWGPFSCGCLLFSLTSCIFPMNRITYYWTRRRDERTVIKYSLTSIFMGLIIMVNYRYLFESIWYLKDYFTRTQDDVSFGKISKKYYDCNLGMIQYIGGLTTVLLSCFALQGATSCLMSKVVPTKLNGSFLNSRVISCILSSFSRVTGDTIVFLFGLPHHRINADIVNSIAFCLFCFCCASYYIAKRHYFSLNV